VQRDRLTMDQVNSLFHGARSIVDPREQMAVKVDHGGESGILAASRVRRQEGWVPASPSFGHNGHSIGASKFSLRAG
jgi:hypothetical protein